MSAAITMAGAISGLVAEKRAVGYKYDTEERVLARFAAFSRQQFPGLKHADRASVEAWITAARQRAVRPATLQGLAAPVRELARWLGRRGAERLSPAPPGAAPARSLRPAHLHRPGAGGAVRPTDRCHYDSQVPFRHLVMPVLFRTIYACGLRVLRSPAAALRRRRRRRRGADDPRRQGRQGPAGAGQRAAARTGSPATTPKSPGAPGGEWFFPGHAGQPLTLMNVDRNFRRFLWQARIPHGGRGHGPRVHDLRHVMAVNNLRSWFAPARTSARCCRSCRPTWVIPRSPTPTTT